MRGHEPGNRLAMVATRIGGGGSSAASRLSEVLDRPTWHDEALCAEVDMELWFPEKGGSTQEAKAICRRCPVRRECLSDALDNIHTSGRFGVWGGLSERERRRLLRVEGEAAS